MDKVWKFANPEVRAASRAGTRRSCSCHAGREPGPTGAAATLREDNRDSREARPPCRKTTGTHRRHGHPMGRQPGLTGGAATPREPRPARNCRGGKGPGLPMHQEFLVRSWYLEWSSSSACPLVLVCVCIVSWELLFVYSTARRANEYCTQHL